MDYINRLAKYFLFVNLFVDLKQLRHANIESELELEENNRKILLDMKLSKASRALTRSDSNQCAVPHLISCIRLVQGVLFKESTFLVRLDQCYLAIAAEEPLACVSLKDCIVLLN